MAVDKVSLKVPAEISNFAAAGFFACCANCKVNCGRKRSEVIAEELKTDLAYCCSDFIPNEK